MVYSQSDLARIVLFYSFIVLFVFHKPLFKWKCFAYISLIKAHWPVIKFHNFEHSKKVKRGKLSEKCHQEKRHQQHRHQRLWSIRLHKQHPWWVTRMDSNFNRFNKVPSSSKLSRKKGEEHEVCQRLNRLIAMIVVMAFVVVWTFATIVAVAVVVQFLIFYAVCLVKYWVVLLLFSLLL